MAARLAKQGTALITGIPVDTYKTANCISTKYVLICREKASSI
jgi:hypothetical protein